MPDYNSIEKQFLEKITEITEQHISNEQFGVSELAHETGMSRSNLLRKVKKLTGVSVSQFIRQIRLQHAKEMLHEGTFTVSEVHTKSDSAALPILSNVFVNSTVILRGKRADIYPRRLKAKMNRKNPNLATKTK